MCVQLMNLLIRRILENAYHTIDSFDHDVIAHDIIAEKQYIEHLREMTDHLSSRGST